MTDKKITHARAAVLSVLGCCCVVVPARTQELNPNEILELDTVVSIANRSERPIQQVGSSVAVLERWDLERNQDRFLLDSLRLIPGLYLRNNGGPGGTFGITTRGLSGNRPSIRVNGIEVSNPSNAQVLNPGNLLMGNLARVEVLKGPQSSLYGADALAGVISIDALGSGAPSGGRVNLGFGSYGTYEYGLGFSGAEGGLTWSVDANVHESDGFSAQDPEFGSAWADDDAYEATNLSGTLNYVFREELEVFLSAYYLDAYSEFDPGVPPVWGTPYADNYSVNEEFYLRVGGRFQPVDNWSSEASIGYADVNFLSSTAFDYFANGDRYQLEWKNEIRMDEDWRVVAGLEHEIEDNRSDVGDRENTSLYVENLFSVSDELDLSVGGRHDDNSRYGQETTFRATFSFRPEALGGRLHGSFGTSFQAPTFLQLNPPWGSPDLKPESGEGWDLGYEQSLLEGRLFWESTLFGNTITDRIDWDGSGYANISVYESRGIENALRFRASSSVDFSLSHTYSDAEVDSGLEALRVPRNVISAAAYWSGLDDKLALGLVAQRISSQFSTPGDRFNGSKQAGYGWVNFSAQYELSESRTVWVRLGNLFDEAYSEIRGYQTAGRHFNAGLRMRF